jgi:addiction module RelE/StbE family toxin
MQIEWNREALGELEWLDPQVARGILGRLTWLAQNFGRVIPEPLGGKLKGLYKFRVGDWRVIYTTRSDIIHVLLVGHRREIYRQ